MGIESKEFRKNLADKVKEVPKEQRQGELDVAKSKNATEYWKARSDSLKERQGEEIVNDGLGIFLKNKNLYHGSPVAGIKNFATEMGEFETIGTGIYMTSDAKDAIGYAHRRSAGAETNLYETSVQNLKLFDLRKDPNIRTVMLGFADSLWDTFNDYKSFLQSPEATHPEKAREKERAERFMHIYLHVFAGNKRTGKEPLNWESKEYMENPGKMLDTLYEYQYFSSYFGKYVQSLGYDGIIAYEGGEGSHVGNHDTYLVFNPDKISILKEQAIPGKTNAK
jgi:hypothetical protein